jgi:tetratricopeptide (TPR) repeat protein
VGVARLDQLRRQVEVDPASIAFAQLAEECRRAGEHEEAVRIGQAGLVHHPAYLSARVTFGRALTELGRYDEARAELERVVAQAPDNLAAIRGLADLHQRLGVEWEAPPAPSEAWAPSPAPVAEDPGFGPPPRTTTADGPESGVGLDVADLGVAARYDRAPGATVDEIALPDAEPARPAGDRETFDLGLPGGRVEDSEIWAGAEDDGGRPGSILGLSAPRRPRVPVVAPAPPDDPVLAPLERWLSAIQADRVARSARPPAP